MLRLQLMHDMDQIRLQYRDGTPLPRPNTAAMGFELYDRLNRCPVDWNGYGTPLVYRAHVYKRGSYVLRHQGRDVWEYSTDDWAAYWKEQEVCALHRAAIDVLTTPLGTQQGEYRLTRLESRDVYLNLADSL